MKYPPNHIRGKEDREPLFCPDETVLDEALYREAEYLVSYETST